MSRADLACIGQMARKTLTKTEQNRRILKKYVYVPLPSGLGGYYGTQGRAFCFGCAGYTVWGVWIREEIGVDMRFGWCVGLTFGWYLLYFLCKGRAAFGRI